MHKSQPDKEKLITDHTGGACEAPHPFFSRNTKFLGTIAKCVRGGEGLLWELIRLWKDTYMLY